MPLLLAGMLVGAQPVAAATLRAVVELRGSSVHLSDLFLGLEAGQDCALGDAPEPGSRLVIQQPQIEAIAAQFGVSWEPLESDQTVTLERPGRVLSEAAVLSMAKAAIVASSGAQNARLSLNDFADQKIDLDAVVQVGDVTTDQSGEHFEAVVTAQVDHRETLRLQVRGSVERLVSLPVPARAIAAGQIIDGRDLVMSDVAAARLQGDVVERSSDAVGLVSLHGMQPGRPIARSDLRQPDLVVRGGNILMRLTSAGIDVAAQGQALEAGAMAERIRVLNPVSHAVLVATVIGPNEVSVDPDSLPAVPSGLGGSGSPLRMGAGTTLAANVAGRYPSLDNRP